MKQPEINKEMNQQDQPHQNFPIPDELAIKRTLQREPIDETCWAWMKLLREKDATKKVYPVNPYAEVYKFRDNLYGILTISPGGTGDPWIFLIDGPEKAMLIDTSYGFGDLKGLCRALVGEKELIVVNTHFHLDHAYGDTHFDEVYCHEYDAPVVEAQIAKQQDPHIWDSMFDPETGRGIWADFSREALPPCRPCKVIGVPDGYIWDLGDGYEIELVFLGGHSAGQAGFLDKQNRTFFAGDDIISMRVSVGGPRPDTPYGEYATVNCMGAQMHKLAERLDEFDHVFSGHFVCDLESIVVQYMAEACDAVIADPVGAASFTRETPHGLSYFRYVEGLGTLSYTLNSFTDHKFN